LVIPSSRVTSHLNVRQQASVGSSVVGTLSPSESAELLGSVPYWYHIRLSDSTEGFVSKAWASTISDSEETGELIRLGSWNIKKLGHGNSKNYTLVAQVIESNFDLLVVVEVMQKGGGHPGYEALLSALGSDWTGLVTGSPRPNTSAGHAEYYAIFYRRALIRPCAGWGALIYYTDNDGGATGSGVDHFSREPAFGCFEAPVNDSSVGIDFMLAAYHARWADGHVNEISAEVGHLGEVFGAMGTARPGERDFIIVGDFNLVPENLRLVVTAAIRSQGSGSTLNSHGQRTTNLYDHMIVFDDGATSEMIGNAEVLDVRNVTTNNQEFFRTISDHLPIAVRLRTSGTDDD
jgi:hypothetical protein